MRIDGRERNALRPFAIRRGVNKYAEGAALVTAGDTRVLCTASVQHKVPPFMRGEGRGWVTAEYSMLPRATAERNAREAARGRQTGRTQEIQRLIGRGLRAAVDMEALGERAITLDCDVLQADGGTRTASITGAFVALVEAVAEIWDGKGLFPVRHFCAAVSVGRDENGAMLDLCYAEDSRAAVDMNVVMLDDGTFVEVQGTGEGATFTQEELGEMLALARAGIESLIAEQKKALGDLAALVGSYGDSCVLLATHNKGKIREFQAALAQAGAVGVPVGKIATLAEPEETGTTFAENAALKARYYMDKTGLPALADDSGLEVEALGGAPGVHSARWAGRHGDDAANNEKLLEELKGLRKKERRARYVCELALRFPDGREYTACGTIAGVIAEQPAGTGGFGYDPYFYLPDRRCTMAELPLAEKNAISHRGRALAELLKKWTEQKESML